MFVSVSFQDACDKVCLELHGGHRGLGEARNAFDWKSPLRMGFTRAWEWEKRKKKSRNYVKVRCEAGRQYEGRAWPTAAVRCPLSTAVVSLPQANAFPSSETPHPRFLLVDVDLLANILRVPVSRTRGSRTLIHLTRFPHTPSPHLEPSKCIAFLD